MRPVPSAAEPVADAARSLRFEQRVLPHLDAAYGLARWLTRAEPDAEDVLQEAMLRAYRYYDGGNDGNVRAWLLTIVRNTFYTLHQQATAAPQDEFDETIHSIADSAPTPEMQLLRDADVRQLRAAIELLPLEFREVLVLREFEECSYKDIAEITGLKLGTVMSRLARARDRLARTLCGQAQGENHHAVQ
jgi:RNA polymerase sigma-70 factor (ECF subfamily)